MSHNLPLITDVVVVLCDGFKRPTREIVCGVPTKATRRNGGWSAWSSTTFRGWAGSRTCIAIFGGAAAGSTAPIFQLVYFMDVLEKGSCSVSAHNVRL